MIISDLNYFEVVSETYDILGGKNGNGNGKGNGNSKKIKISDSEINQTAIGGEVTIKIHKSSDFQIIASADAVNSIQIGSTDG